jgi:hypothetical protein
VLTRWLQAAAPLAVAGLIALGGLVALRSLPPPVADGAWRAALAQLGDQLAGHRLLVTPRPAAAMVTYYLNRSDVTLDSDHPADVDELRAELKSGEIDVVLRWGNRVEPGGAAAGVIGTRPADGEASVGGTIVSWWRAGVP